MAVTRLSISFDPELDQDVRDAAESSGESVSTWLAEAARRRLQNAALGEYLDAYEAEHGAFTEGELARARREVGL